MSAKYSNYYFKQQSYSTFGCFQNKKLDNKANNKLTNMNITKQEKIYHIYSLIFIFARAQDLRSAGAGVTKVTIIRFPRRIIAKERFVR